MRAARGTRRGAETSALRHWIEKGWLKKDVLSDDMAVDRGGRVCLVLNQSNAEATKVYVAALDDKIRTLGSERTESRWCFPWTFGHRFRAILRFDDVSEGESAVLASDFESVTPPQHSPICRPGRA